MATIAYSIYSLDLFVVVAQIKKNKACVIVDARQKLYPKVL